MFTVMRLQGPALFCGPLGDLDKLPTVPYVYVQLALWNKVISFVYLKISLMLLSGNTENR